MYILIIQNKLSQNHMMVGWKSSSPWMNHLAWYIFHGRGVDHGWDNIIQVALGYKFDDLIFFLASFILPILTLPSMFFLLVLFFSFLLVLFHADWGFFTLSGLDILKFWIKVCIPEICLMFLKEKSRGGASYETYWSSSFFS